MAVVAAVVLATSVVALPDVPSTRSGFAFAAALDDAGAPTYVIAYGAEKLVRVNARTGRLEWERAVPHDPAGGPLIVGSTALVLAQWGRSLYGIDCETGRTTWVTDTLNARWRDAGGRSFRLATDGRRAYLDAYAPQGVVAVDPANGRVLWAHSVEVESPGNQMFVKDLVPHHGRLMTTYDVLDADTGRKVTALTTTRSWHVAAVAAEGSLVVVAYNDGTIQRLAADSYRTLWTVNVAPLHPLQLETGFGALVVAASRGRPFVGNEGEVRLLDPSSGRTIWTIPVASQRPLPNRLVAVDSDNVYITASRISGALGRISARRRADGSLSWQYDARWPLFGPTVSSGDLVFARTTDVITALDRTTGIVRWQLKTP